MPLGRQNFLLKFFLEPVPLLTSLEPVVSLSPSWSLCVVIESSSEPPRHHSRPLLSPFTRRHLPQPEPTTPSTTQATSPSPRCHSRAHNNIILPEPMTLCTRCHSRAHSAIDPRCPQARSSVILPEPTTLLSP
jgi:hypothetical protein